MNLPVPNPNAQGLSWFYGEFEKGSLILSPKYQRNPIWSLGQKCFLIDSIISGYPLPQVFINIKTEGIGKNKKTYYEVVDGQQRLRTIIEFMKDEWKLVKTTARSYPVSELYIPHINKLYSELPNTLQDKIWNYPLAVQELREWEELQIRALFRRLNYVVEKLNKQEMRHSQYFGEFVNTAENLAKVDFWDDLNFFTRRDSQRMLDVEFVSELFAVVIDGIQDQQKTLDNFYAGYDVEFPKKSTHIANFNRVLESLSTITSTIQETRFLKKADFYGLFAAVATFQIGCKEIIDLKPAKNSLVKLSKGLDLPSDQLGGVYRSYYSTVIEGPNKISKRRERTNILVELLKKNIS